MRIAHIVSTYPPYYGGMGNTVFHMAGGLAARGHDIVVFTPGVYGPEEIRPAEAAPREMHTPEVQSQIDYAKRLKPSLRYGNAARLPSLERELKDMDVVHLHYPFFGTANLVRRWKERHPDRPLFITYHMDTRAPGWKGLVFAWYSTYWMPKILRSADCLIASSFDFAESSQASMIFAEAKEKWIELPFGVDSGRFKPRAKPEALFIRHKLRVDVPTFLFVGGMDAAHYFKGVPVLLQALLLLKKAGVDFQAVFIGDGGEREKFELTATGYRLGEQVRFVGHASDEELPYYYNMADLFILPSTTRGEAFGMVLLEAMASGLPVLASDLPGVRTVAEDGGLVVTPGDPAELADAMLGFLSEDTDREEWGRRVRAVVEEKYQWERIVERLDREYQRYIDKNDRST